MTIRIRRLSFGLGAEVFGVDPTQALPTDTVAQIRAAWLGHLVLVFPDMEMSIEQHIAFSRNFGELEHHPVKSYLAGTNYPEILRITNRVTDGKRSETSDIGRVWHTDGAFTLRPPTGSLLHCRAIPKVGGDTWFTNLYLAYDRLSATMKSIVNELSTINSVAMIRDALGQNAEQTLKDLPPVVQPMVRVHPETGRKALYISEGVISGILGMTREEGEGLLKFLYAHCVRPEFTYRHRWRLHDLVLWDNRCTQHLAPLDYDHSELRDMCRTTLIGAPLGRLLTDRVDVQHQATAETGA